MHDINHQPTFKPDMRKLVCRAALTVSIVGSLVVTAKAQCPPLTSAVQLSDNLTNNASPFVYVKGSTPGIAYEDHASGNLAVDRTGRGSVTVSNISINHNIGLGDVTAAVLNGTIYIDFLNSNGVLQWVTTSDGITFSSPTNLGIANADGNFTPALASYYGKLYAAYVYSGTNGGVYFAEYDGSSWKTLGEVSTNSTTTTRSRPSLAVFNNNNNLYIAYTNSSGTPVTGQVEASGSYSPNISIEQIGNFGYKNAHGVWAGVTLVESYGFLYIIGQSTISSQYLYGAVSSTGLGYAPAQQCTSPSEQLRWTPGAAELPSGSAFVAYQSAFNTQVITQTY